MELKIKIKYYLFVLTLLSNFEIRSQSTVFLSAIDEGRGVLRSRDNESIVITPNHLIVGNESRIVNIIDENQREATGKFFKQFPGVITIIKVEKGSSINCKSWYISKDYSELLAIS